MTIYVQGASALAHYRSPDALSGVELCPRSVQTLKNATSSFNAIAGTSIWRLGIGEPTEDRPLEVLVSSPSKRSRARSVRPRVWTHEVPRTAFRHVSKDIYVSSPEFVFLQMATKLTLPQLAALGMELCGTYRRNVDAAFLGTGETSFITVYQLPALTTPKRLQGFVASMKSAPGQTRALKALEYVLPNSASPVETAIVLLLCLPRRLGGYALPLPTLNPPIAFSKSGRKYTLRNSAKPDLYWEYARIDLEYNSDEFHTEKQRAVDSMRRKALERMNVEVIELTANELYSTSLFHATALRIASRFRRRIRSEAERGFAEKRKALREELLVSQAPLGASEESGGLDKLTSVEGQMDSSISVWLDDLPYDNPDPNDSWEADGVWMVEDLNLEDTDLHVYGSSGQVVS